MRGHTLREFLRMGSSLVERVRARPAWLRGPLLWEAAGFRPILSLLLRTGPLAETLLEFDFHTSERIVENAWLHRWASELPAGSRVLDLGCAESRTPFELASLGLKVTGVDLRDYPLRHPNLEFVQADLCGMPFPNASFDFVSCLSTLEHVGVPTWGIPGFPEGDRRALAEIRRVLKPGGRLYLTVPFGVHAEPGEDQWQRVYDHKDLRRLLEGWGLSDLRAFRRLEKKHWVPARPEEVERIPSTRETGAEGVALCLAERP